MTVRYLIEVLKKFDNDTEVRIDMIQRYGSNFAMNICDDIEEHNIRRFYGNDIKAVVLTQGEQIGTVDYDEEESGW